MAEVAHMMHGVRENFATHEWEVVNLRSSQILGAVSQELPDARRLADDIAVRLNHTAISSNPFDLRTVHCDGTF